MNAFALPIALIIAYVATLAAANLLSQPLRIRVDQIGDDLLLSSRLSKAERQRVEWLMSSSMSTSVGLMIPVAAVFMLAGMMLGASSRGEPDRDRQLDELHFYYVLSVMACSPFAALLASPFIAIGVMIQASKGSRDLLGAAEAPVMKAAAHFQPAC